MSQSIVLLKPEELEELGLVSTKIVHFRAHPEVVKVGDKVVVEGQLIADLWLTTRPIGNADVKIIMTNIDTGERTETSATTDENGRFIIGIVINKTGTWDIYAYYPGSALKYRSCTSSKVRVKVVQPDEYSKAKAVSILSKTVPGAVLGGLTAGGIAYMKTKDRNTTIISGAIGAGAGSAVNYWSKDIRDMIASIGSTTAKVLVTLGIIGGGAYIAYELLKRRGVIK